jgi:predicted nucleotidyltransferase component of viral defense system
MDIFRHHEIFEIEVLDKMKCGKVLEPLVFGGGTMLRLCHEVPRYSVDLDFWLLRRIPHETYLGKLKKIFEDEYEITDSQVKHDTILVELRSSRYPKRLKIEIHREKKACDFEEKIAFSRYSTKQVVLRAHTLAQTMANKMEAFLDRGEIRDCFDVEFLLRRGVALPAMNERQSDDLQMKLAGLKERDFKVKLGSILEREMRTYYLAHRFSLLEERLAAGLSAHKVVARRRR